MSLTFPDLDDESNNGPTVFQIELFSEEGLNDESFHAILSNKLASLPSSEASPMLLSIAHSSITQFDLIPQFLVIYPHFFDSLVELRLPHNALTHLFASCTLPYTNSDTPFSPIVSPFPEDVNDVVDLDHPKDPKHLRKSQPKAALLPTFRLPSLHTLDVSHNFLSSLPEALPELCPALSLFRIDRNRISSFPASYRRFENLSRFFFAGNPLPSVPRDIRSKGSLPVLEFLIDATESLSTSDSDSESDSDLQSDLLSTSSSHPATPSSPLSLPEKMNSFPSRSFQIGRYRSSIPDGLNLQSRSSLLSLPSSPDGSSSMSPPSGASDSASDPKGGSDVLDLTTAAAPSQPSNFVRSRPSTRRTFLGWTVQQTADWFLTQQQLLEGHAIAVAEIVTSQHLTADALVATSPVELQEQLNLPASHQAVQILAALRLLQPPRPRSILSQRYNSLQFPESSHKSELSNPSPLVDHGSSKYRSQSIADQSLSSTNNNNTNTNTNNNNNNHNNHNNKDQKSNLLNWTLQQTLDWIRQQTWLEDVMPPLLETVQNQGFLMDKLVGLTPAEAQSLLGISTLSVRLRLLREISSLYSHVPNRFVRRRSPSERSTDGNGLSSAPTSPTSSPLSASSPQLALVDSPSPPTLRSLSPSPSRSMIFDASPLTGSSKPDSAELPRRARPSSVAFSDHTQKQMEIVQVSHQLLRSNDAKFERILTLTLPHHSKVYFAGTRLHLDHPQYQEFRDAALNGKINQIARMLAGSKIPSIDVAISDGRTFLHLVLTSPKLSVECRLSAIEFAIQQSASKDLRDTRLNTPLFRTAQMGCLDSYFSLINAGFSQYCCCERFVYPLEELLGTLESQKPTADQALKLRRILSFPESRDIVQALVLQRRYQHPLLFEALEECSPQLSLIQQFSHSSITESIGYLQSMLVADPSLLRLRDHWGFTAAAKVVVHGNLEILKLFITYAPEILSCKMSDGSTLLHLAILHQREDIVVYLVDLAPTIINQPSTSGFSPLHVACLVRSENVVRILLQKGVSVSARSECVLPPLLLACLAEAPRIIEMLVAAGAPVVSCPLIGFSPPTLYNFMRNQRSPQMEAFFSLIFEVDFRAKSSMKRHSKLSLVGLQLTDEQADIALRRVSTYSGDRVASIILTDNSLTKIPPTCLLFPSLSRLVLENNYIASEEELNLLLDPSHYSTVVKPYLSEKYRLALPVARTPTSLAENPRSSGFSLKKLRLHNNPLKPSEPSLPTLPIVLPPVLELILPIHGSVKIAGHRILPDDPTYLMLKIAGQTGNSEQLSHLLDSRKIPSIDCAIAEGRTFLHLLFELELARPILIAALQFCFARLVTADLRSQRLSTALHGAGQAGQCEAFYLLMRYGFSPMCQTERGKYPLEYLLRSLVTMDISDHELSFLKVILVDETNRLILDSIDLHNLPEHPQITPLLECHRVSMSTANEATRFLTACSLGNHDFLSQSEVESPLLRVRDSLGYSGPAKAVMNGHLDVVRYLCTIMPRAAQSTLPDGSSLLHLSILHRKPEISTYLLDQSPKLAFSQSALSYFPLHMACLVRDDLLTSALLHRGAPLKSAAPALSPLYCACFASDIQIVELLLSHGAPIEKEPSLGVSPFELLTLMKGWVDTRIQRLFQLIGELDQKLRTLSKWQTSISLSRMNLTDLEASILLKRLASLNSPFLTAISLRSNNLTSVPLECLQIKNLHKLNLRDNPLENDFEREFANSRVKFASIMQYLMNLKNGELWQLVHDAAFLGHWADVEKYLRHRFITSLQHCNPLGETILHRVLSNPELSHHTRTLFIKNAVLYGVDPNSLTFPECETPLHYAARLGCVHSLMTLIDHGAIPLNHNLAGETFLHILIRMEFPIDLRSLLLRIFEKNIWQPFIILNSPTRLDLTSPLHLAVQNRTTHALEALLSFPAIDLEAFDAAHHKPFHLALRLGNLEAAKLLQEAGASLEPPRLRIIDFTHGLDTDVLRAVAIMMSACIYGQESLFTLSSTHISLDTIYSLQDNNGLWATHLAIRWGRLGILKKLCEIVQQLLGSEFQSFVSRFQMVGRPSLPALAPLHLAAELAHVPILEYLLSVLDKSNLEDVTSPYRLTPLMSACLSSHVHSHEIVEMLIKAGVNIKATSPLGDTALHYAVAKSSTAVIAQLLSVDLELISVKNAQGFSPMDIIDYIVQSSSDVFCRRSYKFCQMAHNLCLSLPVARQTHSFSLANLSLSDLDLESLVSSLRRYSWLRHLDLRGNMLTRIPIILSELPQLKSINLDQNPHIAFPHEQDMIRSSHSAEPVLQYLNQCRQNALSTHRYLKVVLCGREAAGKTSLAQCLVQNKSCLAANEREYLLSTDGVDIHQLEGEDLTISLWDFAGQYIYESLHQFMVSQSILYLVIWDLREPPASCRVEHWCDFLQARVERCQVLLVGTHVDLVSAEHAFFEQQYQIWKAKYPFIIGLHLISTVTGYGVLEIRRTLTERLVAPVNLNFCDQMMIKYIRALVAEHKECPVLSFNRFFNMTSKITFFHMHPNPLELLFKTLQRLHQMGEIIFLMVNQPLSKGPLILSSSLIVLDPKWLSDLMISVVTTKFQVSRGLVSLATISHLLKQSYSDANIQDLLTVLQSFGAIIPVSTQFANSSLPEIEHTSYYLIPVMLPPMEYQDTLGISTLCFQYDFPNSWNFERLYFFEKLPLPMFSHLLASLQQTDEFGELTIAWKNIAVFNTFFSGSIHHDALDFRIYLEQIDNSDQQVALSESGLYLCLHAYSVFSIPAMLHSAAKIFRRFQLVMEAILTNLFPGCPQPVAKIPCPTCPVGGISLHMDLTSRHHFPLRQCVSEISTGQATSRCPRCINSILSGEADPGASSQVDPYLIPFPQPGCFSLFFLLPDQTLADFADSLFKPSQFTVGRCLGQGGFGSVNYTILDLGTPETPDLIECAMKVLEHPDSYHNFVAECLNISESINPYIVRFLGCAVEPTPAIFLEYVAGDTLHHSIHDPWKFLDLLELFWKRVGQQVIVRDNAKTDPGFQEEQWEFRIVFSDLIKSFSLLTLPTVAAELSDLMEQMMDSAETYYSIPDATNYQRFTDLVDKSRLVHMSLLQSPEMSFSGDLILRISIELARALAFLHSLHPPLLHLDVKSINILLTSPEADLYGPNPIIKLADFGSSSRYQPLLLSKLCPIRAIEINPRWAAPELMESSVHPGSDIWGWGLVVWEMYAREIPFEIFQSSLGEAAIAAHIQQGMRPIIPPNTPQPLAELLALCWDVSPVSRPTTEELLVALDDYGHQYHPRIISCLSGRRVTLSDRHRSHFSED